MKRKISKFTSDEQAEAFLEQELSDLDFSQFKPTRFEFQKKTAQINMRGWLEKGPSASLFVRYVSI